MDGRTGAAWQQTGHVSTDSQPRTTNGVAVSQSTTDDASAATSSAAVQPVTERLDDAVESIRERGPAARFAMWSAIGMTALITLIVIAYMLLSTGSILQR